MTCRRVTLDGLSDTTGATINECCGFLSSNRYSPGDIVSIYPTDAIIRADIDAREDAKEIEQEMSREWIEAQAKEKARAHRYTEEAMF